MLRNDRVWLRSKLAILTKQADSGVTDLYQFTDQLIDVLTGVTQQRDELRSETEPVRKEQAEEILRLRIRMDELAQENIAKSNDIQALNARLRGSEYEQQKERIEHLANEVERCHSNAVPRVGSRQPVLNSIAFRQSRQNFAPHLLHDGPSIPVFGSQEPKQIGELSQARIGFRCVENLLRAEHEEPMHRHE